ncbi:MAG: polysaccharide deacetylase family protein [Oligoflexia bacterium]|nr:polysaccharide deacetylase family protein [Oligoflexia bacterium]
MKLFSVFLALLASLYATNTRAELSLDSEGDFLGSEDTRFSQGNVLDVGLRGTKRLALTFDDGPTPTTRLVLDVLRKHGIKAVFFINGKNTAGRQSTMNQIFEEGHLLANHTERHGNLRSTSDPVSAIAATHQKIKNYVRSDEVFLFRAPFGAWKSSHAAKLNAIPSLAQYVGPVFWDVGGAISRSGVQYGAADWACWSKGYSVSACTQGYVNESLQKKGGIVLFHDVNAKTAQMLDRYITTMKANGYSFVRLDTLPKIRALQ